MRDRRHIGALLGALALTCAAAGLRLYALAAKSFWIDEGASVAIARMDWYNFGRLLWRREANMSLYYLLLRPWLELGSSEEWVRGLSVAFGVATIPVIYFLGRKLFGEFVGLSSAALLAVHAFHIRYSQEARSYALVVFLVTLGSLLLIRLVERPGRGRTWAYATVMALAIYAQFFAVLVVAAHWCAVRKQLGKKPFWMSLALSAPVWLFIVTTGAGPLNWLTRPSVGMVAEFGKVLFGWTVWGPIFFAVALIGLGQATASADEVVRRNYRIVLLWLALPVALTLAVSFARPMFLPRYMIVTLPALVLAMCAGIAGLKPKRFPMLGARAFQVLLVIALVVTTLTGAIPQYGKGYDITLEDWRSATGYIVSQSRPGDAIIFHANQGRMPFTYYGVHGNQGRMRDTYYRSLQNTGAVPEIVFPRHGDSITWRDFMGSPDETALRAAATHERVWVVLSHNAPGDPVIGRMTSYFAPRFGAPKEVAFEGVRVLLFGQ